MVTIGITKTHIDFEKIRILEQTKYTMAANKALNLATKFIL